MGSVKVFIADKSPIFTVGLAQVLSSDERIEVVGQAHSGQDVIDRIEALNTDVVVMDFHLPEHGGIQVLKMLQKRHPGIKVIILTPPDNAEALLDSVLDAGAKGFLPNTISPAELVEGVVETAGGGVAISHMVIPLILNKLVEKRREKPNMENVLSTREREVTVLVAKGMGNREIAETLFITENTVKGHIRRIIDKLRVNNRVEVARYVLLNGLSEQGIPEYMEEVIK